MTRPAGDGTVAPDALRDDLVLRLLEQCAHALPTGEEGPLTDAIAQRYAALGLPVRRVGDSLVVGAPRGERPLVLLVGHLDVVPPTDDDRVPRIEVREGTEVVVARGASDMKAGNVVAMEAFEDAALRVDGPYDLALVLYAGEEGPAEGNELGRVLAEVEWLRGASLAVVLEPTDGTVELGCLGGIHAEVTFRGRAAHSARPWQGVNALTAAGTFLAELDTAAPLDVEVDGLVYRDVWTATMAWTGGLGPGRAGAAPRNVVPDTFTVNLNLRFAPSRDLDAAEAELRARVGERAEVTVVDRVPPAAPMLGDAMVARFVAAVDVAVGPKQAWTDVARFAELGVPALNFGPGATAQAHQRGEHVRVDALTDAAGRLRRFLAGA
jgi:succinyl-diaminopimelate desuccinylase